MRAYLAGLAVLTVASVVAARGPRVPPSIELDGCVQPAPACAKVRDVVQIEKNHRKLPFAVDVLRIRSGTNASTGKLLTELKLRGLRLQGPDPIVAPIEPGAHIRIRGALRMSGVPYLLVQGVDPLSGPSH
jgi:hypothetical protein